MIKVNKIINLEQLDKELNGKGLNATNDDSGKIVEISLTENNDASQAELQAAINAHIAQFKVRTVSDKLAALGLTSDDLKALGL